MSAERPTEAALQAARKWLTHNGQAGWARRNDEVRLARIIDECAEKLLGADIDYDAAEEAAIERRGYERGLREAAKWANDHEFRYVHNGILTLLPKVQP